MREPTPTRYLHLFDELEGFMAEQLYLTAYKAFIALPEDARESCPLWFDILGDLQKVLGNFEGAIQSAIESHRLFPMIGETAHRVSKEVASIGKPDEAYEFLISRFPEPLEPWLAHFIVMTHTAHCFPEKAVPHFRTSFTQAPDKNVFRGMLNAYPHLEPVIRMATEEIIKESKDNSDPENH